MRVSFVEDVLLELLPVIVAPREHLLPEGVEVALGGDGQAGCTGENAAYDKTCSHGRIINLPACLAVARMFRVSEGGDLAEHIRRAQFRATFRVLWKLMPAAS